MSSVLEPQGPDSRQLDALESQAHAWVRRLTSGKAREIDAQALRAWCETSPEHAQAFKKAHRQWQALKPAAEMAGRDDPELAALRSAARGHLRSPRRRALFGGALATCAAAAGVALVAPTGLWPLSESWRSDYRTVTGEQRKLTLARNVTVEMNTRSSIALRTVNGITVGIELIDGETAVDALAAAQPFTVSAGGGRIEGQHARFEVRNTEGSVCVTCIEGMVRVVHAMGDLTLRAAQQVAYDKRVLQAALDIAQADLPAWREGILSFHGTQFASVVAELNRYRPGRIVVLRKDLDDKPVSGRFHIHDLDKAVAQIQRLFRLDATSLPGGIVVLS